MAIVVGIDVGISTTKIVGIDRNWRVFSPIRIKATDPVTSLYGAFGKFLHDNSINLSDVERVVITGVGSAYVDNSIYGLPTDKVEEFIANGNGASFETHIDKMIVVSMGTGTSLIECDGDEIRHLGGLGIGGGTLMGLSKVMLKTDDIKHIIALALQGTHHEIDVSIGDISPNPLPGLPKDATASLFGNAKSTSNPEDIALGIITLVLQTIGSASIMSSLGRGIDQFVLIGNLTLLPQCKGIFSSMEKLYNVHFIVPKLSEFCTAIGAAVTYMYKRNA